MSTFNFLAFYSEAITLKGAEIPSVVDFTDWKNSFLAGEVLFSKVSDGTNDYYVYRRSDGQKFKRLVSAGPYSHTDGTDTLQAVHLKQKLNDLDQTTQIDVANLQQQQDAIDAAAGWSMDNTGPSDVHQRGYYKVHVDNSDPNPVNHVTSIYLLDEQDSANADATGTNVYKLDLVAATWLEIAITNESINLWNIPRAFWKDVNDDGSQYKMIERFLAFESDIITTDNAQVGFPDLSTMNEEEQSEFVNSLLNGPVAVREVTYNDLKYYLYQLSGNGYDSTTPFAGAKYMWQQLSDDNGTQLATSVYQRIHDDALNQKFTALHVAEKRDAFSVPVDLPTPVTVDNIVCDGGATLANNWSEKDSYYKVDVDSGKFYLLKAHSSTANTDVIEVDFSVHYLNSHISNKQIDLWNVPSALWSHDGTSNYQMTARFLAFDSQAQTVTLDGAVDFPVEEEMSLDARNAFLKEFLAGPVRVKEINDGTDDWYVYQLSHDATVDMNRTNPFKANKYKKLVTNGVYNFKVNERSGTDPKDLDTRDFRALHLLESGTGLTSEERAFAPDNTEYRAFVADVDSQQVGGWGDDAFYQLDGTTGDLYIMDVESTNFGVSPDAEKLIRKVQCTVSTITSDNYEYVQQAKAQDGFGGAIQNQLSLWNVPDALWSVHENRYREISRFLAFESQAIATPTDWSSVNEFPTDVDMANKSPAELQAFVDVFTKSQVLVKQVNDGSQDYYVYQLSRQDATLPFKDQQQYKRLVSDGPYSFQLTLGTSTQTFEARHVQKLDALPTWDSGYPVVASFDQVVYEELDSYTSPDYYYVDPVIDKFYLVDAEISTAGFEVTLPSTSPTASELQSSPYMSDYKYFHDVVSNDQISLWNYPESFWLYDENGAYKFDTKSVVAFRDQALINTLAASPTPYPTLDADTSTWTEDLRNKFLNGPVKFGISGTDYVYQLSSDGTNPWTVPFQGPVYSSPTTGGPISNLLLHAIHAEEMKEAATGFPSAEVHQQATPVAYEQALSDIRESWDSSLGQVAPFNTDSPVTANHDITVQYKVHDSYLYFFGENASDELQYVKIAQTTTDAASETTLNYTQQSISSNQFLAWEVPLNSDGTSDYWKFENGVWTFHSSLVDMNVDSGTVDVDATVTTTVQDPESLADQYADLVGQIEAAVNQLDPSVFSGIGSLSDYESLITEANNVSQTLSALNEQTNAIGDLAEIGDVIGAISQQLSTLTVTLSESVTLDASSALNSIKTFLSHYDEMRQELEKFRIQITLTRTIIIPQSLLTAINLLTSATTNMEEVSVRFAHFAGVSGFTENGQLTTLGYDPTTFVLSGERKEELDNAVLALKQLDAMSDKIIEDVHNEYLDEMKVQTDAIKSTLSRWESISLAIAGKIDTWNTQVSNTQTAINNPNPTEIGDSNTTDQQDVTVNDP